jgi:hypothetical protein
LCQAACIGDGGYLALHILQEFRNGHRGKAEVRQGQVAEKQIHGCVEMRVQSNEDNDEEIPQDSDKIHGQEQDIEQVFVLWLNGQVQGDEF